ncbi:MAG: nuclear transport factor 2 family protein [Actinobacteria bacterium]|nr:nuclear transport factor 2 family protein [Actinomycetota bacterium]
MSAPAPEQIVRGFYDAYNAGDATAAAALYAKNGAHLDMATGARSEGRDQILAGLQRFFASFGSLSWTPAPLLVGRRQHAAVYQMRLIPAGRDGDREAVLTGVHTFELGADGITETRDYWDLAELQRQLA